MSRPTCAIAVEGSGSDLQDRARVIEAGSALVLAVADGAGGSRSGGRAAELITLLLETFLDSGGPVDDEETWENFLHIVDLEIAHRCPPGESTAVVLTSGPDWVLGASVGDSEAWLVGPQGWVNLTSRQRRKPLLGSGAANPVGFRHDGPGGTLVLGSDGLFKYAPPDRIRSIVLDDLNLAPARLIDLARMPNGTLQDDASAIVCRRAEG